MKKNKTKIINEEETQRGWICGWKNIDVFSIITNEAYVMKRPNGKYEVHYDRLRENND